MVAGEHVWLRGDMRGCRGGKTYRYPLVILVYIETMLANIHSKCGLYNG